MTSSDRKPSADSQQHGADIKRRASVGDDQPARYGARRTQGVQAGDDFPGPDGPHDRRIRAGVARAGPRQDRRAERAVHRARRHRLRSARLLRLADQHAEHRQAGAERPALHQHAHHRAVLAVALVHADRAQSPLQRHGVHHRGLDRLSRRATARSRSRTASCPRCCCSTATPPIAVGKWHLTPAEQISAAGPYDRWPLGRGFERYYGFLGGDTHQYYPDLVYDNHQVEPPKTPEEGYHLTADLADKAIEFIADLKQVAPDKPFFLYFAPAPAMRRTTCPKEWADKYKGKFDDGWDAYREKVFARQKELGIVAAGRGAVAARPRRAGVGQAVRPTSASSTPA